MSTSVYFGPYLHCKVEMVEHVVNRRCCTNMDCENKNLEVLAVAHKFCNKCGKEIRVKGVPVTRERISAESINLLNAGDVMRFLQPEEGVHLWLSNMTEMSYYLDVAGTDYEIKDVQNFDFAFHIARFTHYYESALKELNSFYGEKNCSIRFAILIWEE